MSPDGRTLYALLQSATIQDGGSSKKTSRFTRLLAYDVSEPLTTVIRPPLIGEWVVPLPQDAKGSTLAQSELQACEAHLAERERELADLRAHVIHRGLLNRCQALMNCGTSLNEMGKDGVRALQALQGQRIGPIPNGYGECTIFSPKCDRLQSI